MTPERRVQIGARLLQALAVLVTAVLLGGCALLFTGVLRLGQVAGPGFLSSSKESVTRQEVRRPVRPPERVVANEAVKTAVVADRSLPQEPPRRSQSPPLADAGEDQLGLVGRAVTLDGIRSEPRGGLGYRWLQISGPAVTELTEKGAGLTFVPKEVGVYRFALVVAGEGQISQPDMVEVQVGTWKGPTTTTAREVEATSYSPPPAPTLSQVAQSALAGLEGGSDRAEDLARNFEDVAARVALYASYSDLFVELSRRLDSIVPQEPALRKTWLERLFGPLTAPLIAEMRRQGLDLLTPAGQAAPLNTPQRDALAEQFREMASGFRQLTVTR